MHQSVWALSLSSQYSCTVILFTYGTLSYCTLLSFSFFLYVDKLVIEEGGLYSGNVSNGFPYVCLSLLQLWPFFRPRVSSSSDSQMKRRVRRTTCGTYLPRDLLLTISPLSHPYHLFHISPTALQHPIPLWDPTLHPLALRHRCPPSSSLTPSGVKWLFEKKEDKVSCRIWLPNNCFWWIKSCKLLVFGINNVTSQ